MFDFNNVMEQYARNMGWGETYFMLGGVYELQRMQDTVHGMEGPYAESKPTIPLFEMPPGFEMREWDNSGGRVIGNVIYVTNDKKQRPFIEAHELGHAWNLYESGVEKALDELQACLRGAKIIAHSCYSFQDYWDLMWLYLRLLGVGLTWDGYQFLWEPSQIQAAQFAWSVANGDILLCSPLAQEIK